MKIDARTVDEYMIQLPPDRRDVIEQLRQVLIGHLPQGFKETMAYDMIGYVVPHDLYPAGYHCNPQEPLPFISLASQKNYVALYHMGVYAFKDIHDWFVETYPDHAKYKLDMGKSCIRFKKLDDIPYALIAELATKITVEEWIGHYEKAIKK